MMNLMMKNSLWVFAGSMVALIGTGMVVRSMPYGEGFGAKQLAWMLHSGVMGAVIAPMCIFGGPLILRAAWMTAGIVGGLSTIAVCAPSEKFLKHGRSIGHWIGTCLCIIYWFHVSSTNNCSWRWTFLHLSLRWANSFLWISPLRHSTHYPPSWKLSSQCCCSIRSYQRLHVNLPGHNEHFHSTCSNFGDGRWAKEVDWTNHKSFLLDSNLFAKQQTTSQSLSKLK